jgi:TetR/AcrR family transcriptional regulator, tetracycline repressor protein
MSPPRHARTALSRDRVLQAALDLVDHEGVEALTMRRLGRALGVEAMSLYGYVASKDDLIDGAVELVFRQMPRIEPARPEPWQQRVRRHAAAYRAVLLDHPKAVRLVAGRPLVTEGTAGFVDSALAELCSVGLDVHTADRVLGVIASFTLGHVAEQVGDELRASTPAPRPLHETIDGDRFPHLAAVGEMKPTDYDQEFDLGLDFIVAGLERLLADDDDRNTQGVEPAPGRSSDPSEEAGYDKLIG